MSKLSFISRRIAGFAIAAGAAGVLAAQAAWALDVPRDGAVIAIRSTQNDKFVRAGLGDESHLGATSGHKGAWEKFRVVRRGENRIALRSWNSGKFVRAGLTNLTLLGATSNHAGGWETFELVDRGGGKVALRSVQNGKYVRAGVGEESKLAASSDQAHSWETFQLVAAGVDPVKSAQEVMQRLGCSPGSGAPAGKIRVECPMAKLTEFGDAYLSKSTVTLDDRHGRSYLRYRFGPERIPELDFTQQIKEVRMDNIHLGDLKITPHNLGSKSVHVTNEGNNLGLRLAFESKGTEFTCEEKAFGSYRDYLCPDLHWDRASINLAAHFADDPAHVRIASMSVTGVHGAWGVRLLNGIATDGLNNKINGSIRSSLDAVLADPAQRDAINKAIASALAGKVLDKLGLDDKHIQIGVSGGKLVITLSLAAMG